MTSLIQQFGADVVFAVANERWLNGEAVTADAVEADLLAQMDMEEGDDHDAE